MLKGASAAALSHAAAMPAAAEENNEAAEIPTKCVTTKINLNLKAQIQYLDFEGIHCETLLTLSQNKSIKLEHELQW